MLLSTWDLTKETSTVFRRKAEESAYSNGKPTERTTKLFFPERKMWLVKRAARKTANLVKELHSVFSTISYFVPIAVETGLIIFSVYVYNVSFCGRFLATQEYSIYGRALYRLGYIITFVPFIAPWIYLLLVPTKRAPVLPSLIQSGVGLYCTICPTFKDKRTHHCRTCRKCIPRMDHHCPWFGKCIGQSNHKLFVQFLFYASIHMWYMASTVYTHRMALDLHIACHLGVMLHFILSVIVFSSLSSFLFFHVYLSCTNQTTLEWLGGYRNFDRGVRNNVGEMFGPDFKTAFIPLWTEYFATRRDTLSSY